MTCRACSADLPVPVRFCPSCGAAQADGDQSTLVLSPNEPSSGSLRHGRFLPGTLVGSRFRIVAMLGRGGMGEVFRADDLKLGQPVALKFLPHSVTRDDSRLARLFAEVRIARQIAHPNICRVYDVVEVDGEHFISMEYIEGENLTALLRRIGRLPETKGLQIARQIASGIAAAHEKGVLHRDLKPSNIMLDERGIVRITDFGLAAFAEDIDAAKTIEGTPAYMAPEQLAGEGASSRSDIYSFGLVLYEVFTGHRAFESDNIADLLQKRHDSSPSAPSTIAPDINPAIERVIIRCLEHDPQSRPSSAMSIVATLPGGDPLAAALAAGEIPSPDLLATANTRGMRVSRAVACLITALLALAVIVAGSSRTAIANYIDPLRPEVLATRARAIARSLGYPQQRFSAMGYDFSDNYLHYIADGDKSVDRWQRLSKAHPSPIYFWYRESPWPLVGPNFFSAGQASMMEPPQNSSDMLTIVLDGQGNLESFSATTHQVMDAAPPKPVNWAPLFADAGLNPKGFRATRSKWAPLAWGDTRAAWSGTAEQPDVTLRVEAAANQGKVISFDVIPPWMTSWRDMRRSTVPPIAWPLMIFIFSLPVSILAAALFLTHRNLRLGRGDRRGAFRVAVAVFATQMIAWLFGADHQASGAELTLGMLAVARAFVVSGIVWMVYVGIEPYIRRRWPQSLVGWNRILTRQFRDAQVGREALIGITATLATSALVVFASVMTGLRGSPSVPTKFDADFLLGFREVIGAITMKFVTTGVACAALIGLLFIARIIFRRDWIALVAIGAAAAVPATIVHDDHLLFALIAFVAGFVEALIFVRFGLVALLAYELVSQITDATPMCVDPSSWMFGGTLCTLALVIALTFWAFRVSLAGQPLFTEALLET